MAKKPVLKEENVELRRLYDQGKRKKLWTSKSEAARTIGVMVPTFAGQWGGYTHGQAVLDTQRLLRKVLGTEPTDQPIRTIRHLFQIGKDTGKWQNYTECAKAGKFSTEALTRYMDLLPQNLKPRSRKFLKRMFEKLRTFLEKETKSPGQSEATTTVPVGDDVIAGSLFNQLLAGVAELRDQHLGGIRFVLRHNNFRRLKGIVTKEEIGDTKLLIEELRRRFNLLAEIDDEDIRGACHKALGDELDELFLAYRLIKAVVPTAAVQEIELLRERFQHIKTNSKDE